MRKDRNTFFSESNMFQSNYPNQQMMGQPMMQPGPMMQPYSPAPYQQSTASNSFYTGPAPVNNAPMAMPANPNMNSDIESRLAKMERQIRRLETRVNKLESTHLSNNYQGVEDIDVNFSNSMYMI